MTNQNKMDVLEKIGQALNKENITWAVGGSLLLYLSGIANVFHDIDLMVAEEDAAAAEDALVRIGQKQRPNPDMQYRTRCFLEFIVDGVEVDLISGFVIVKNKVAYECPLEKKDIEKSILVGTEPIPLHSLKKWERYYSLMDRPEKSKMISDYFLLT